MFIIFKIVAISTILLSVTTVMAQVFDDLDGNYIYEKHIIKENVQGTEKCPQIVKLKTTDYGVNIVADNLQDSDFNHSQPYNKAITTGYSILLSGHKEFEFKNEGVDENEAGYGGSFLSARVTLEGQVLSLTAETMKAHWGGELEFRQEYKFNDNKLSLLRRSFGKRYGTICEYKKQK